MARKSANFNAVLELGTYELRLLTLESARPGEVRLKKCLSTTTPKDFVASTYIECPIIDPLPLQKALQSLVRESKLPYDNTLLVMPDHSALLNLMVTPPRYSRKEMDEAIKEDFVPIMPMPYENWHVVQQSIGSWEEDEVVLAIALIKNNLLEAGGIVQNAGLNPIIVDLNILNVANLIEHHLTSNENKGKNICLVHLGHESTSIGLFKDGQMRALQNRPIGACDFTKQISKHFHVPELDADQFKRNEICFLPEPSPEQDVQYNFTVIKNVFAQLCREVFGAIEAYLTKFREFTIHEVIVSGGGANYENIHVALSANLNTRVRRICELYQLYVNGSPVDDTEKNSLAAACGCYLRG